ncbi:MAG: hypothetical protein KAI99_20200 [Cyclobacteriaceae bacterium]|nr:hypothetical protein [Cyclobacteriaceae bacterium]
MSVHKIKIIAFFILFSFSLMPCIGQVISSGELKMTTILNSGANTIPKDLLLSKTIVVISINDGENKLRGDWKSLAEGAHFYIRKLGIDAVLYFYIDDLIAGFDVQRAITEQMNSREVKNIFILSQDKVNGRDQFIGVLTQYNQKPNFISNNQVAWKSQTSDLEILFRNLARAIDNANLTLENLLIIDSPEFFRGVGFIKGRRSETFNTDLRIDRLAIPKFEDLPSIENSTAESTAEMVAIIDEENSRNLIRNGQLEQLMADYPYKFEIVPYEYDEKKLLSNGFQFVLMSINSSGRNVRKLLGYKNVNELITTSINKQGDASSKSIKIDGMVYKYYVKHINSGDIYLGEQWDGDDNWQDAFNNHITVLLRKLEKK